MDSRQVNLKVSKKHNLDQWGEKNPNWKGARVPYKDIEGYVHVYDPTNTSVHSGGYVREHVYVFQNYHKCCLLDWGIIHHKNHIKDDNRLENLEGMTAQKHMSLHKKIDMDNRICLLCNSNKTFIRPENGRPRWYNYNDGVICKKCYYQINKKIK